VTRTNHTGRQRIVSLAPSATSILVALGAQRELVGVTKWCKDVAPLPLRLRSRQTQLGDCWSLDPERVLKLRPTLVIGSVPYKPETVAKLLEKPLTFLAMNPRTLADIESDILLLGRIAGCEAAAGKLVAKMRQSFAEIKRKSLNAEGAEAQRGQPVRVRSLAGVQGRVHVYCEAWPHPRISSPSWVAELVEIAGGRMVVPPASRVTDAEVARARPDVIVIAWAATGAHARASVALANPAWQDVPAVRNRRVYVVRDEILNTPGPPLVEGARELFRILHPAQSERTSFQQDRESAFDRASRKRGHRWKLKKARSTRRRSARRG